MDLTLSEKALTSKTFCVYPWIHQYVGPDGEVKPCCIYEPNGSGLGNIKNNSLKEVWNNDSTKQLRLDMLNGVEVSGCSMCNNRTGLTVVHRDGVNKFWFKKNSSTVDKTNIDGSVDEHKLKYIDARFNNLCNFKCRTCTPYFSTSWHEDYEKLRNPNDINKSPKTLLIPGNTASQLSDEIWPHLPEVERIYFAGGEPLMQIEHYKILEELIRLNHTGSIELQYSTNFSNLTLGKHNALAYWKKFSRVFLYASLDGSYERAEYWRKGTEWTKIVQNIIDLKETCPHVIFRIGFTLSWINAFNLLDLHKEWVEKRYINVNLIEVNILDHPSIYSLKNIPTWKKKKIEDAFLKHIDWLNEKNASIQIKNSFMDAISFMNSTDHGDTFQDVLTFKSTTESLDKLRNENFWEVFPEHNDIKESVYGSNTL